MIEPVIVLIIVYLIIAFISLYPIIFQLIIIYRGTRIKETKRHGITNGVNNVYVVIPAKSEPLEVLEDAMRRFSSNNSIFILDNYPRELRPLIESMASKHGVRVMFREKAVGYKGGALNHVIRRLGLPSESYMVVFDVDSSIKPEYMKLLLGYAQHYDAVIPHWVISNNGESQLARGQWIGYLLFFKVMNSLQKIINWTPILGSGSIVNIGSLRKVGYWPEDVLEDVELGVRFFINGLSTYYADDVLVNVEAPMNYWGFLTQQIRWSFGASKVLRKYLGDIVSKKGGYIVALYLGQYTGYLFQLLALLLMVSIVILGLELPPWAFVSLVIMYIPTLSIYLYKLLRSDLEMGGNVKRDVFAINAINLAFIMAMPRLAAASLMGLTGLGKIEWVPTPKGSAYIKRGLGHLIPEFMITFIVIIAFILSIIRGLWFNSLVLLPYTMGFIRGLWRILNRTL